MENQAEDKGFTYPIEKFPRLQSVMGSIENAKKLVEHLNERKRLITSGEGEENLSAFEKNERQILLRRTDIELAKVHTSIIKNEQDVRDYEIKVIKPNIGIIDAEFDILMKRAEKKAEKDEVLRKVLRETDEEKIKDNWEYRFNHFAAIKNYLYPNRLSVVA